MTQTHVSTFNKAIRVLLMHRFGTLNTLVELFIDLINGLNQLLKENVQPPVDLEMATIYIVLYFS